MSAQTVGELRVAQYLTYLAPEIWDKGKAPVWPPDAFALVASLLHVSGAYTTAVARGKATQSDWVTRARHLGEQWRKEYMNSDQMPLVLKEWWDVLLQNETLPVREVWNNPRLCDALLLLCAAADEASRGIGLPHGPASQVDAFDEESSRLLARWDMREQFGSSLCKRVHPSRLRVLPKFHTPQSGLTIRSLTHHLALCPAGEVKPFYHQFPIRPELHSLNLLLLPWPQQTTPAQFAEVPRTQARGLGRYSAFRYDLPPARKDLGDRVASIVDRAAELVGPIDGVIFPELALRPDEYDQIVAPLVERNAFLLCGISREEPGDPGAPGQNHLQFFLRSAGLFTIQIQQHKHHRWVLDKSQIIQYGLGGRLNPSFSYAENIAMRERTLNFFALRPALSVCALICEDLARPDPVADVIRAVGPNLVIALLMDGPQLVSRWPARYATVLADDPGSSVLTLTNLGMAQLSRPLNEPKASRVIALWKDAQRGAPNQIELPPDADGVVLSLAVEQHEEWTADGRSDQGMSGYPILSGVHPVAERRKSGRAINRAAFKPAGASRRRRKSP